MPTTVIKSIGIGAGRDYPSITAWRTDRLTGKDVRAGTGSDTIEIGEMYNDGVMTETVIVQVTAGNADATHGPILRCAAGHSFRDNGANPLTYDETKGVAVRVDPANNGALITLGPYVTIEGIQFKCVGTSTGSSVASGNQSVLQDCVIDSGTRNGSTGMLAYVAAGQVYRRNLIIQRQPGVTICQGGATALNPVFEGNTVLYPVAATAVAAIAAGPNFRGIVSNNLFLTGKPSMPLLSNAGDVNVGTNGGDLTFNQGTGVAIAASDFVNGTGAGGVFDMRLKAGSAASGAGVAYTGDTQDVFKTTRPNPPALGMHEYVAQAPAPAPVAIPRRWARVPLGMLN